MQHPHQPQRKKPSAGLWSAKQKDSASPIPPYPTRYGDEAEADDDSAYETSAYDSAYPAAPVYPEAYQSGYSQEERRPDEAEAMKRRIPRNYQPRPAGRGHPVSQAQPSSPARSGAKPHPTPQYSEQQYAKRAVRPHHHFYDPEYDDDFVPNFRAQPYRSRRTDYRFWVLGGVLLVGLTVLIEPTRVISSIVKTQEYDCQEVVQPRSVLSREQLTQLLTIPERSSKDKVRAVMEEPYCLMPSVMIRAGIPTVREAYPLEFDPDMWIVMLYEGDEYAGYRFNAR